MYTISRRISNLEDIKVLMREKTEKAVKVERASRSLSEGPFVTMYELIDIMGRYYSGF